jgi:hypothetical protein
MTFIQNIKNLAKPIIPSFILKWKQAKSLEKYNSMNTQEIFSSIYEDNTWGGKKGEFCSGSGTLNENASKYISTITDFITKNNIKSVLDIGCGDYSIMSKVVANTGINYTGTDIVPKLIDHHNSINKNSKVNFICLNAIEDKLPIAELCLIRQVLQHLDNSQIQLILNKLENFKYVIITEHVSIDENVKYNLDKKAGPDVRIYKNSGVFIDEKPFNLKTKIILNYREDFEVFGNIKQAEIRSSLILK